MVTNNYKWSNFIRYDKSGRRLSIFCDILNEKELIITVIPCAKKDVFSKKDGIAYFKEGKGVKHIVPIIEDKPIKTFMNWCKENYYRKTIYEFNFNKMWNTGTLLNVRRVKNKIYYEILD